MTECFIEVGWQIAIKERSSQSPINDGCSWRHVSQYEFQFLAGYLNMHRETAAAIARGFQINLGIQPAGIFSHLTAVYEGVKDAEGQNELNSDKRSLNAEWGFLSIIHQISKL